MSDSIAPYSHETGQIRAMLQTYGPSEISGAKLHDLIRRATPNLNIREAVGILVGPGALSTFVSKYLSDILAVAGSAGGDVKYTIAGVSATPYAPSPQSATSSQVWRAFVSPGSSDLVVVNAESGALSLAAHGVSVSAPKFVIEPCSAAELQGFMAAYIETLDQESQNNFRTSLPPAYSYASWLKCLSSIGGEHFSKWLQFRKEEVLRVFVERVEGRVPAELVNTCVAVMRRSYQEKNAAVTSSAVTTKSGGMVNVGPKPGVLQVPAAKVTMTRDLAQKAIASMSIEQLRELRIPLGVMVDMMADWR